MSIPEEWRTLLGILCVVFGSSVNAYFRIYFKKTQYYLDHETKTGENLFPFKCRYFYDLIAYPGQLIGSAVKDLMTLYLSITTVAVANLSQVPTAIFTCNVEFGIVPDRYTILLTVALCLVAASSCYFYVSDTANTGIDASREFLELLTDYFISESPVYGIIVSLYVFTTALLTGSFFYFMYSKYIGRKKPIPVLSLVTISGPLSISCMVPLLQAMPKIWSSFFRIAWKYCWKDERHYASEFKKYKTIGIMAFFLWIIVIVFVNWTIKLTYQHLDIITISALVPTFVLISSFLFDLYFIRQYKEVNLFMFTFTMVFDIGIVYCLVRYNNDILTKHKESNVDENNCSSSMNKK